MWIIRLIIKFRCDTVQMVKLELKRRARNES